jgi:hypothetical protein
VFATHDDPGYCQALSRVNHVSLVALVNSVPGMESSVMNIAVPGAGQPHASVRIALGALAILPFAAMILTRQVRRLSCAPAGRQNAARPTPRELPCPPPAQPFSTR